MVSIYLKTFGCSLNKFDSDVMKYYLKREGFKICEKIDNVHVIIINSCGVKKQTEDRIISYIKKLRRRFGDEKKIILTGCLPLINYKRIVKEIKVNAMLEANKEHLAAAAALQAKTGEGSGNTDSQLSKDPISPTIEYDDFAKIDLRVVKIVKAEHVKGADKLLQLTLDLGGETRNVFAGIKSAYNPSDLEGKMTVMVANLAPRKMRFGISEGMVLAAGPGGEDLFVLNPDKGALAGMRVK